MTKFRSFLNNPNVHLVLAALLQIAAFIPAAAPFAPVLQAIGITLTGTGAIIPESGPLHREDYAKLVQTIADGVAVAVKKPEKAGRA